MLTDFDKQIEVEFLLDYARKKKLLFLQSWDFRENYHRAIDAIKKAGLTVPDYRESVMTYDLLRDKIRSLESQLERAKQPPGKRGYYLLGDGRKVEF